VTPVAVAAVRSGTVPRLLGALVLVLSNGVPSSHASSAALPRSSPEAQGVSSAGLLSFVESADSQVEGLHSFMLVRHGHVVAEGFWSPYDALSRHQLYSLTKSFTSTAVGLAVAEGRLGIDDPVLPLFPDDAPAEASDNLKAMRVRDLLSMSTGHHAEPAFRDSERWVKAFLAEPVFHKPGTFFLYNTPATNTLAAIVEKAVGATVLEYLRPRLFEPLGIEDPRWDRDPQGRPIGGFGLYLRTEEIARFGQLYLQKGRWGGRTLVPAAWVEAATARQVSNGSKPDSDWEQGYGYQFWRCRHRAYRGDGAFGQFCVVLPEQDAVVAITSGVRNLQAVLNVVWDRLLPALLPDRLPEDEAARDRLRAGLARLTLAMPQGKAAPAVAPRATGRRYVFPANEQKVEAVSLERKGDSVTLVGRFNGLEQRLALGRGTWTRGRLAYASEPERPVAASGAWTSPDTYVARIAFYETPFVLTLTLRFEGDQLFYGSDYNVAFAWSRKPEPLVGSAAAK
jgi:CubicO group peptidase (beta-lactamase class C family)